ncbi:hypothetical protein Q0M30_17780, partial [Staphylococcus aureus]|nr:hypothetical protein [Staphylococcus aureus]
VRRRRGLRFGYELSAATTRIARHLASEATGGDVLCGGAVYRMARQEWNFEEVATIELTTDPGAGHTPVDPPTGTDGSGSAVRAR